MKAYLQGRTRLNKEDCFSTKLYNSTNTEVITIIICLLQSVYHVNNGERSSSKGVHFNVAFHLFSILLGIGLYTRKNGTN